MASIGHSNRPGAKNVNDPSAIYDPGRKEIEHPVGIRQLDYNARALLWVSRLTDDPKYARAWQATFQRHYVKLRRMDSPFGNVKVPEKFSLA